MVSRRNFLTVVHVIMCFGICIVLYLFTKHGIWELMANIYGFTATKIITGLLGLDVLDILIVYP